MIDPLLVHPEHTRHAHKQANDCDRKCKTDPILLESLPAGYTIPGGVLMELQRMQLETLKLRMQNGETVQSTRVENGEYIVQLSNAPEIAFDDHYKPTVEKTIGKTRDGVRENTLGNDTAAYSAKRRPGLESSTMPTQSPPV